MGNANESLWNNPNQSGNLKKAIEYNESRLKTAKKMQDKIGEGMAYESLANLFHCSGDFRRAVEYQKLHLKISKEIGEKSLEGRVYGNLGISYRAFGDFKKAIECYECSLKIAKEVGNKVGEGAACGNLGLAYRALGDFKKAIYYHECHLRIAKEVGDKVGEGGVYSNLGNVFRGLGYLTKAIAYHECHLKIAKEVGDKAGEGIAYGNLGSDFRALADFKRAIEYHECHLRLSKELRDKAGEGRAYRNLGNTYHSLGDFKRAIEYHERDLRIAREVGDKAGEGRAFGNLGIAFHSLGDLKKAIECYKWDLEIAKEVGDKAGEEAACGNLGNAYDQLGDFKTSIEYGKRLLNFAEELGQKSVQAAAYGNLGSTYDKLGDISKSIECQKCLLQIAKEIGDRNLEGGAYGNLGNTYYKSGDFKEAIEYYELRQKVAKEVGDKAVVSVSFYQLGQSFEGQGSSTNALECYRSSVMMFNEIRAALEFKDEWKINYRDTYSHAYNNLWRLHLNRGEVIDALFYAEEGRAQALKDLMEDKYGLKEANSQSHSFERSANFSLTSIPSTTVFVAFSEKEIFFWVINSDYEVELRKKGIEDHSLEQNVRTFITSLNHNLLKEITVRDGIKCENRSLDEPYDVTLTTERAPVSVSHSTPPGESLKKMSDIIIAPIADLFHGDDLILVPEGPFCLVPYVALVNPTLKYLSELYKIRMMPSLSTLKLVTNCPTESHNKTGALLVGDPCLEEVLYDGKRLCELPFAKKEVEMIERILCTAPLIGKKATKGEVLKGLSTVALIHIAAHGSMETGEIALAPNPIRESHRPREKDFLLTMADVLQAQLRARLVVLSCCHSARGEIKAEGVVGIARAFLGAGARSVLVSLWAIDDEATFQFMKHFYKELVRGRRVCEALDQAMKCMRESGDFREMKHWAPFALIGDDVTLELNGANAI